MEENEQVSYVFRMVLELFVGLQMLSNIKNWRTDKIMVISILAISLPLLFLAIIHAMIVYNLLTVDQSRSYTGWVGFIMFTGMYAAFNRIQVLILRLFNKMNTHKEL